MSQPSNFLGKKHSEESKKKLSDSHLGKIPWNKDKKWSENTKNKISKACEGRIPWNKGLKGVQKHSKATKLKMSKIHTGQKHTIQSKQKISESWTPRMIGRGIKGHHNGIYYDSSYELHFMQLLDEYKIPYERADNKKFRVKYTFENQERFYYPDFYLPREGSIVEIKSSFGLNNLVVQLKLEAAQKQYGTKFIVITEQEIPELKNNHYV